jgi:hypothetical protein
MSPVARSSRRQQRPPDVVPEHVGDPRARRVAGPREEPRGGLVPRQPGVRGPDVVLHAGEVLVGHLDQPGPVLGLVDVQLGLPDLAAGSARRVAVAHPLHLSLDVDHTPLEVAASGAYSGAIRPAYMNPGVPQLVQRVDGTGVVRTLHQCRRR